MNEQCIPQRDEKHLLEFQFAKQTVDFHKHLLQISRIDKVVDYEFLE